jgi:hypothetical protein
MIKKVTKNEQAKLSRETLSDKYIIELLKKAVDHKDLGYKWEFESTPFEEFPDVVACKRVQLKIERILKIKRNEKNKRNEKGDNIILSDLTKLIELCTKKLLNAKYDKSNNIKVLTELKRILDLTYDQLLKGTINIENAIMANSGGKTILNVLLVHFIKISSETRNRIESNQNS